MNKRLRISGIAEAEEQEQPSSSSGSGTSDASAESTPCASDSEDASAGEVQVDFEFHDPRESDFLGLKALLHTYLDGQDFSCSQLVEAIIKQARVGH